MSITISVLLAVHNNIYAQIIEHVLHTKVRPQIKVDNYPIDLEVTKDTNKIYVANYKSRSISVINSDSGNIKNIPVGVKPRSIAIDDRSNNIYVANLGSGLLSVIDGYNDSTIKQIHVGTAPLNILYDDFSSKEDVPTIYNKIYVTNSASKPVGSVTVINGSTYEKEKNDIQVGKLPSAIAIDEHANVIYVANRNNDTVTVIDGTSDKTIANVTVSKMPFAIAFDSKDNKTYVVNRVSNTVSVIDDYKNGIVNKNDYKKEKIA